MKHLYVLIQLSRGSVFRLVRVEVSLRKGKRRDKLWYRQFKRSRLNQYQLCKRVPGCVNDSSETVAELVDYSELGGETQ